MGYIKELEGLSEEARFASLRANKEALKQAKVSGIKETTSVSFVPVVAKREPKQATEKAAGTSDDSLEEDLSSSIDVTVICNTAWFCDDQMDVIVDTAYDASVKAKGASIPHIKDHIRSCTAHVGDVKKVYTDKIKLSELGLDVPGTTTALFMESSVKSSYDEKVFEFYKSGKINQHSIGLKYIKLSFAMNSKYEEDKEELAVWDKYYPSIINKELVDKRGYFWALEEMDILENSCVLFGANPLTPTLSVKSLESGSEKTVSGDLKPEVIIETTSKGDDMDTAAETLVALQAEVATLKASQQLEVAKATKVETGRVVAILKAGETFGIKASVVANAIEKGFPLDLVTDMFTTIAENTDKSTSVTTAGGDSLTTDAASIAAAKAAQDAANKGASDFNSVIENGLKDAEAVSASSLYKGLN